MAEEGTVAFPPLISGAALCGWSVERKERITLSSLFPQVALWRAPGENLGLQSWGKGWRKQSPEMASSFF